MAVPKRKAVIMRNSIKGKYTKKEEIEKNQKPISDEEHEKRLRKLKELGLLK